MTMILDETGSVLIRKQKYEKTERLNGIYQLSFRTDFSIIKLQ